jgi:MazG family protein
MTDTSPKERPAIDDLLEVMARLRDPENGCPWDREQTFSTIAPYTIEEAYEVADAIETGDVDQLEDELGDLLFQVVFYAQISVEAGGFDFDGVARRIAAKMRDRHPHVFGGGENERTSVSQTIAWEEQKATERAARAAKSGRKPSALDGVALALPALMIFCLPASISRATSASMPRWPSATQTQSSTGVFVLSRTAFVGKVNP